MKKNRGFTLIELLVVISIIGVLTSLILANLSDARARARDSQKKSELTQLKTALRLYYNDNQKYPANSAGIGATGGNFSDGATIYMKKLPIEFTYAKIDDDSFTLSVPLENASDSDISTSQTACSAGSGTDFVVCSD